MKTAISLPDAVFLRAERAAKRLGKSRSQLYADAVNEYVCRHDPGEITEAMNRVCDTISTKPDAVVSHAARRILRDTAW